MPLGSSVRQEIVARAHERGIPVLSDGCQGAVHGVVDVRDLDVDFVAIDEIQLAANLDRGHVFTDRILNRRGIDETLRVKQLRQTRLEIP